MIDKDEIAQAILALPTEGSSYSISLTSQTLNSLQFMINLKFNELILEAMRLTLHLIESCRVIYTHQYLRSSRKRLSIGDFAQTPSNLRVEVSINDGNISMYDFRLLNMNLLLKHLDNQFGYNLSQLNLPSTTNYKIVLSSHISKSGQSNLNLKLTWD
jgi:hypothetical protein